MDEGEIINSRLLCIFWDNFFFFVKVLINYSALLKILFVMFFYQVSRGVSARGLGFGMKDEGWKISEKNIEASGRVVDGGLHQ